MVELTREDGGNHLGLPTLQGGVDAGSRLGIERKLEERDVLGKDDGKERVGRG